MNYYWVIFLLQSVINCSIVFGKTIRGNFSDEYDSATEIEIFEHVSNCTVDVAVAYKANNITKFGYLFCLRIADLVPLNFKKVQIVYNGHTLDQKRAVVYKWLLFRGKLCSKNDLLGGPINGCYRHVVVFGGGH